MLGKLMKYEFKATGRTILPLYGGLLIFALILRVLSSNLEFSTSNFSKFVIALSIFIYGFIMATVFVATFFIIVQRFRKNLLGDEGYLMHTLPIMPYKNILSKLITSSVWSIVSCIIASFSILILVVNKNIIYMFFYNIIPSIKSAFDEFGILAYVIFVEIIILALLNLVQFILALYASISIGHLFNSSKILLSIAAFIALNAIEGFITSNFFLDSNYILDSLFSSINNNSNNFSWLLIICIIIEIIYSSIYFFITNYSKRFNI
ncbi:MAG: ABC transporter permease [Romboutsia sp.]|nr:ABC transporter permease [Romboutsia sp.]